MNYQNSFPAKEACKRKYAAFDTACGAPAENRSRIDLLSFLLTADRAKAELCFVAGLDRSAENNAYFRDWAQSCARRTVINNALRLIAPCIETRDHGANSRGSR